MASSIGIGDDRVVEKVTKPLRRLDCLPRHGGEKPNERKGGKKDGNCEMESAFL